MITRANKSINCSPNLLILITTDLLLLKNAINVL